MKTRLYRDAPALARDIVSRTGGDVRVALPLGLGKPVTLVNALTDLALQDPSIHLSIFTALTLEGPELSDDMTRRFLGPAMDRLFGAYPRIDYARRLREGTLPDNITITEFFLLAGRWKDIGEVQRSFVSVNYSDAINVLQDRQPNVLLQLVARDGDRISLSCNPDITVDLLRLRREGRARFLMAVEVNPELPFMDGEAEVPLDEADLTLDDPEGSFELFSAVKRPVKPRDHAIGLHVSRLIRDGGTLQIGIGTIGDAVAHALLKRNRGEAGNIWSDCPFPAGDFGESGRFETGLYAATEMFVDAMLPLFEEGVIGREVDGKVMHAAFFVGCRDFYMRLREMPAEEKARIAMVPVSFTNTLHGDEAGKRAARRDARFVNAAMKATLLGDIVSDTVQGGQVVSGVGGQHDFVSQAFALQGARSIIAVPATRSGGRESNIVWSWPHVTAPRQMRDIVVTEYGIADLRGRSDTEVVARLLAIADSRYQNVLLEQAKDAGKIAPDHRIAEGHRRNLPEAVSHWLGAHELPTFPFGTDFDATERRLLPALTRLRAARGDWIRLLQLAWRGLRERPDEQVDACLQRMDLAAPANAPERVKALALKGVLRTAAR